MNENNMQILGVIFEHWQIVFLYVFKYLNDISKTMRKFELDIALLQHDNKRRVSDFKGKP